MQISPVNHNYTNRQNNLHKTVSCANSNPAFNGKVMTGLRIEFLDRIADDKRTKDNGWGILTRIICQIKHESLEFPELDKIRDISGNISKGIYKICKRLILQDAFDGNIEKMVKCLNKFKNKDGFYDEEKVVKGCKLPSTCVDSADYIVEQTQDLPEDMQHEILNIFKLYDKKLNSHTLKKFFKFIIGTPTGNYFDVMTDANHGIEISLSRKHYWPEKESPSIWKVFYSIKDVKQQYNMTLIKAVQAIIKYGDKCDLENLNYRMQEVSLYAQHSCDMPVKKDMAKIFKKAGLTLDEVADAKNKDRDK